MSTVTQEKDYGHVPVLLHECLDALAIKPDGIYVDGTLGRAGHSLEIVKRLTTGRLIGIDRDETAIAAAQERLADYGDRVTLVHSNFDRIGDILADLHIDGADGMLFDLGVSSPQLDDAERGFSYMHDAPLDMRMDRTAYLTAREVVNSWSYEELRRILFEYGEERYAPAIAKRIVAAPGAAAYRDDAGVGGHHQVRYAATGAAGKAAPGQAELSGHTYRRQRRTGRPAAHAGGGRGASEHRRAAGGDLLPLAGGPDHQEDLAGAGHRLHLPAGVPGVRMRQEAEAEAGEPEAHRIRRRGIGAQPPRTQRQAAGGGEGITAKYRRKRATSGELFFAETRRRRAAILCVWQAAATKYRRKRTDGERKEFYMANYRHGATYGSLAYDLDALARKKQALDEAGKLPQKKVRPAQPEVQPVQRRQEARHGPRCGPCSAAGNGAGGGHGHRADAVLCEADRHFR